ncbi:hypothetical protein F511_18368 [Dorcoceras hygrometricum]|uniref:Uncharacterized protein n=1 Tax=Dorcoceras hygrometricum TaxID=472368 RepID=A0A2Z7C269_9LAMI|nr:hypothetical protein F511_18368 [Dorcoceras hygrometricum]
MPLLENIDDLRVTEVEDARSGLDHLAFTLKKPMGCLKRRGTTMVWCRDERVIPVFLYTHQWPLIILRRICCQLLNSLAPCSVLLSVLEFNRGPSGAIMFVFMSAVQVFQDLQLLEVMIQLVVPQEMLKRSVLGTSWWSRYTFTVEESDALFHPVAGFGRSAVDRYDDVSYATSFG